MFFKLDLVVEFEFVVSRRMPIFRVCVVLLALNSILFLDGLFFKMANIYYSIIFYIILLFTLFHREWKCKKETKTLEKQFNVKFFNNRLKLKAPFLWKGPQIRFTIDVEKEGLLVNG